jgi:hypothetical protein
MIMEAASADDRACLLGGAERFGLDAEDVGSDARVCDFLGECVDDDERYAEFMRRLREYRRLAGYPGSCKAGVNALLFYLGRFGAGPRDAATCAWVAHSFRVTLVELERMRARSSVRRDFARDLLADDDEVAAA